MARLGFIEILDPKGKVAERFRIDSFPVTIGRAYTNQIIVEDPYVCPEHLRIGEDGDGNLIAMDLDSVNGLHEWNRSERVASVRLHPMTRIRIGHTVLRFCEADQPVATTVVDRGGIRQRLGSPYVSLGVGIGTLTSFGLDLFLRTYERVGIARMVSESLVILLLFAVWAGFWGLVSRIVFHKSYYVEHFTVTCAVAFAYLAFGAGTDWLEFLFSSGRALWVVEVFGAVLLLAALLYVHFALASSMSGRSRRWSSLIVSGAVIGLVVFAQYANRDKFTFAMEYSGVLKPMVARWLPSVSIDQFIRNSQSLKEEVNTLTQKASSLER